ncbi:MAG: alanine racemase [Alcanivorax sp.]|nr:alanine racemase [Alcanivorax sp.]
MQRRQFLIGIGALAAGTALLRPGNHGAPYTPYFRAINEYLKQQGPGHPIMLIDRQRLASNGKRLMAMIPGHCHFRIVAKSLPSVPLIQAVMEDTGSHRVMVFHQPFMTDLARAEPGCDMLLGKPMPINAARRFYQQLPEDDDFDPDRQLQWLIDSGERLLQYLALAREQNRRLNINVEIDVGLHRGGLTDPAQLDALLTVIHANPAHLRFSGFMGYDAHVGKLPAFIQSAEQGHRQTDALYRRYIERLYAFDERYRQQTLCFNGAGSPTLALYDDSTPLNELSAGSCLVKATDFDLPLLKDFQPAAFIATPVIKRLDGLHLPGPLPLGQAWSLWNPNRRETYFIYGGYWKARPVSPAGIVSNPLYGVSTNQMMFNGAPQTALQVDDQLFFRPTQSEFVMLQFGDLAAWHNGAIRHWWPPLSQGRGV